MRVLIVTPDLRTGGAERHTTVLARTLHERGVEVRVLCVAFEGELFETLTEAGVPARCARMRNRLDPRGLRRALAEASFEPDVVLTRGVSAQLIGEVIARRAGAPHLMNEHTPLTADGELLPMRPHQRTLTRLVAPQVDRVVAVSARQVEPLVELGYRRERIGVVANGVFEIATAPDARARTRAALGLDDDDFACLHVAALRSEKRAGQFVEAAALANGVSARVRGLVAGDGPERAEVERRAAATNGAVRLLGNRADIPDLMEAADAVCLLSAAEALPMSILEAMAHARPVIATRIGGTDEAIDQGRTGLLVPPDDVAAAAEAMSALAAEPEHARALGARGRERQRELFDGDAMVDGYQRELEALARGGRGGRTRHGRGAGRPGEAGGAA